jgi:hypothetical protein
MRNLFRPMSAAVAAVMIAGSLQVASGQIPELPIRMRMAAVNMSNNLTGANGILEIRIERWSTPEERTKLLQTVVQKGQPALLSALQDAPVKGRIRIPGWTGADPQNYRTGWNLRYAWHEPQPEGGERIVVAVDRYMSFLEIQNQNKSVDYPFTLVQIHLSKDGKGEGKLAALTMITFNKKSNTLEIENYGTEPVRLSDIRVEKG